MPLINPTTQAQWDSHYTGGYTRANPSLVVGFQIDIPKLVTALGIKAGEPIVIMGAGFGFMGDAFSRMGLGPITCCDPNTHVQAQKGAQAERPILNENAANAASRTRIKASLPAPPAWVITNDAMPWLTNTECTTLSANCRLIGGKVAHWISCLEREADGSQPQGNWKTQAQWKALLTPDLIVQRGTDRVL